jgi:hypothetical protein
MSIITLMKLKVVVVTLMIAGCYLDPINKYELFHSSFCMESDEPIHPFLKIGVLIMTSH